MNNYIMQYLFTYKAYIAIAFYFLLSYLFVNKNNLQSKSAIDLYENDEVYIDIKTKTQECITESNEIHWGQFEDIENFI